MSEEKFGHRAEEMVQEALRRQGDRVKPASHFEDHVLKLDFWVWHARRQQWLPIQFTVNLGRAVTDKGADALGRGVIISWLPAEKLDAWAETHSLDLQNWLVTKFWTQVEAVLQAKGPELERLWNRPSWIRLLPKG